MNLKRMRNRTTRAVRGSQMAFGACLVAVLLATAGPARGAADRLSGTADKSEGNHCVSPSGVDANKLLGISEYLMVPGLCDTVPAGEEWVPLSTPAWNMNTSWAVIPADYTPSAPTPLQDFLQKVRSETFTIDPGTKHERSYRFAAEDILDVRNARDFGAPFDLVLALFLPELRPLPPGDHVLAVSITMSARTCDGLGTEPGYNCLPAGTSALAKCPFTVVPRHSARLRR